MTASARVCTHMEQVLPSSNDKRSGGRSSIKRPTTDRSAPHRHNKRRAKYATGNGCTA